MGDFQIFTGVAIPEAKRGNFAGREPKYPFADMDVNDMLVIPDTTAKAFGGTVRAGEKRTGFFFTLRSGPISDSSGAVVVPEGSIAVWRIAAKPPKKVLTPEQQAKRDAKKAAKAAAPKAA